MKKSRSGYTLIEVIIALALLGILAAGFLPIFFSAYLQIIEAGKRSRTLNEAQDINESQILNGALVSSDSLHFSFTDADGNHEVTVQLDGEYIQNDPLHMFIPKATTTGD